MKKKSIHKPEDIYEKKGVYGDEDKFKHAAHRLHKMCALITRMHLQKARILDLGCGTGFLASQIKEYFPKAEVHGTDISKEAIKEGKKLYKNIKLIVSDSEQTFPYKDTYFDLVISGEHIAHLKNTDVYLSEIRRVLKKKGILILTTPNLVSWANRILMICGKSPFFSEPLLNTGVPVIKLFGHEFPPREMLPSGHLRLFTLDMLKHALRVYGLTVTETYGASSLNNKFTKSIDLLFSHIPGLASGLITISKKTSK